VLGICWHNSGYTNLRRTKNISIALGDHFDEFIARHITEGRYASTSEVVRVELRLLEDNQQKTARLRKLLE